MGQLVDGEWRSGPLASGSGGGFDRPASAFRTRAVVLEPGRYHLYVSLACPWAHRTLITRALRGLSHAISVTVVDPHMGEAGWPFRPEDPDPVGGAHHLSEVYTRSDPRYTGKASVPVLWDLRAGAIVNNESRDIMRMLDVDFAPLARDPVIASLAPEPLRARVDAILDAIYAPINSGVYRCGFAREQPAYDAAVRELFAALAHWDRELAGQRWLCGDVMTEADVAMFTTCLRFDLVYYSHFKCNLRRLRDHANLWRLTRQMWQHPVVRETCDLAQIKVHYYWSQTNVNPTRIVPIGPQLEAELDAPL